LGSQELLASTGWERGGFVFAIGAKVAWMAQLVATGVARVSDAAKSAAFLPVSWKAYAIVNQSALRRQAANETAQANVSKETGDVCVV
jgi:hypothetical protein